MFNPIIPMLFELQKEQLSSLFPFYIVFNTDFQILDYGKSIDKIIPSISAENNFLSLFEISRPRTIQQKIENILKNQHSLFILKIKGTNLELKGQMLSLHADTPMILFVGNPVLKDQGLLNTLGLTLNDFAVFDQTTDFLFLLQSNQNVMQDLQKFSQQINEQNQHLHTITQQLQASLEELQASEEETRQNAEELHAINEHLRDTTQELHLQRKELERKNEYILSSINYARKIQQSILPTTSFLDSLWENYFVLFMPKDILSGDFYWAGQKKNKSLMIAVDCTGHGVPGAFMSLIAKNLLDQIINEQNITEPDWILENMHVGLRKVLNQQENFSHESVDIAVIVIDKKNKILEFAGARNALYLCQNDQITALQADKYSVGGYFLENNLTFNKQVIPLNSTMRIYLCTDGYKDQFGGLSNKKYSSKALKSLLLSIQGQPMSQQAHLLEKALLDWKNKEVQTDDILILGLEIS